jgi:hypothetical protein
MNRRDFISKLGIGVAAAGTAAVIPSTPQTLEDGSLRPKCPSCGKKMLVRPRDGGWAMYAFCGLTTCKRYGKRIGLKPQE